MVNSLRNTLSKVMKSTKKRVVDALKCEKHDKAFLCNDHGGTEETEKQLWKTAVFQQLVFSTRES